MRTIIIDDDQLTRKILEEHIKKTTSLTLVGSYTTPIDAVHDIKANVKEFDLVFLDVEMPEMTGIEFLDTIDIKPSVIIVSGKKDYAVDAFEYDVADFILKPITYSRFYKAVEKVENKRKYNGSTKKVSEQSDQMFIKHNSVFTRLSYNDIVFVEALENYIVIITYDDKFTIHFTMKAILEKLPADRFKRIHRSFIVNVSKIREIEDNCVVLELQEGKRSLPIGKSYKDGLMGEINLITK